ncbi:hypothetical protein ACOSP7_013990 [Xanthoceras sorbifolium]
MQQYFDSTPLESFLDCHFTIENGLENPPTSALFGPKYLKTIAYKHCPLENLELAKMLVRPTGLFVGDFSKECLLTKEKFRSVDRFFCYLWSLVMFSKPRELCLTLQDIAVNNKACSNSQA